MWVHNLNPILLNLGFIEIRWYGFMYFLSAVIILLLLKNHNKKDFFTTDTQELGTYTLLGMIIGARIFYYLFYNFNLFIENPLYLIDFRYGGFSFHGALIGIVISVILFSKYDFIKFKKIKYDRLFKKEFKKTIVENVKSSKEYFLRNADYLALFFPIGLFLGRIGNFINSELYGRKTTNTIIGVIFKNQTVMRHPSQLYEAIFEGLILFLILYIFYKKFYLKDKLKMSSKRNIKNKENKFKRGTIFVLFLMLYSFFRFFIEFFREPDIQIGYIKIGMNFTLGQIFSLIMFLCAILTFYFLNRKQSK